MNPARPLAGSEQKCFFQLLTLQLRGRSSGPGPGEKEAPTAVLRALPSTPHARPAPAPASVPRPWGRDLGPWSGRAVCSFQLALR